MDKYVFEIYREEPDNYSTCLCIILSPKQYYDENGCVYDGGYSRNIINFLETNLIATEVCDSTFKLQNNISDDKIIKILSQCDFAEFEKIIFFPN